MPEERARASGTSSERGRRITALGVGAIAALAALGIGAATASAGSAPGPGPAGIATIAASVASHRPVPSLPPDPVVVPRFDRAAHSIDDPASIWTVVNKMRALAPIDFGPPDLVPVPVAHTWAPKLRNDASDAVVALFQAARAEAGLSFESNSAYRGHAAQTRVYNAELAAHGQGAADSIVARPGHSEHQTGLAIDIGALSGRCALDACFADTPEGGWLAANAWRFGFLLRYPVDKVPVTGFEFEPWHFRYIGAPLAGEMHKDGVTTLEEFFDLPAAPGYD